MESLQTYIIDNALILVPALLVIGAIIKNTQVVKDKFIPVILLVLGIAGAYGLLGISVESTIQGILVSGVSVFSSQMVKQLGKEE